MTTNIILTLTWALATNSVVVSKTKTTDMLAGNVWWNQGTITTTTKHTVTSNLVASFKAFGQAFHFHAQSVEVTNWTTQATTVETGVDTIPAAYLSNDVTFNTLQSNTSDLDDLQDDGPIEVFRPDGKNGGGK